MKIVIAIMMVLASQVLASSKEHSGIMATGAYIREMPSVSRNSAGYMTIMNHTDHVVKLVKVTGNVSKKIEIHTHEKVGETYKMMKLDSVSLKAQGYITFKPKGHHLMLLGLNKPLKEKDHYKLTLHFSNGQKVDVDYEVKKGDATSSDHSHHHHQH